MPMGGLVVIPRISGGEASGDPRRVGRESRGCPGERPGEGWESFEAPEPEDGSVLAIFEFDSFGRSELSKSVDTPGQILPIMLGDNTMSLVECTGDTRSRGRGPGDLWGIGQDSRGYSGERPGEDWKLLELAELGDREYS